MNKFNKKASLDPLLEMLLRVIMLMLLLEDLSSSLSKKKLKDEDQNIDHERIVMRNNFIVV